MGNTIYKRVASKIVNIPDREGLPRGGVRKKHLELKNKVQEFIFCFLTKHLRKYIMELRKKLN